MNLEKVLQKPLIVGASVSANYLSTSPGKTLALNYTDKQNIRTIAYNGSPAKETLKLIHAKDLNDRSIVIGIDLMFWDATLPSPQQSIQALRRLVNELSEKKIPLVIGDIPELLLGWQQSRKIIHDEIHRLCKDNKYCLLLPLDHFYKDLLRDGFITYKNHQYNAWDLVPDGLHIAGVAGEYLAEKIEKALKDFLSTIND